MGTRARAAARWRVPRRCSPGRRGKCAQRRGLQPALMCERGGRKLHPATASAQHIPPTPSFSSSATRCRASSSSRTTWKWRPTSSPTSLRARRWAPGCFTSWSGGIERGQRGREGFRRKRAFIPGRAILPETPAARGVGIVLWPRRPPLNNALLAQLLDADPTLLCVSAWNDHGQRGRASNATALYRTDLAPGLGWMLRRDTGLELYPQWPKQVGRGDRARAPARAHASRGDAPLAPRFWV